MSLNGHLVENHVALANLKVISYRWENFVVLSFERTFGLEPCRMSDRKFSCCWKIFFVVWTVGGFRGLGPVSKKKMCPSWEYWQQTWPGWDDPVVEFSQLSSRPAGIVLRFASASHLGLLSSLPLVTKGMIVISPQTNLVGNFSGDSQIRLWTCFVRTGGPVLKSTYGCWHCDDLLAR